ncbi:ring-cleaving dioxygenase [Rubrobacter indicoceani]|uniref:ring-cleaving dioxygenase n=1 Tax=Rubrobacter indicoceani TaxID=2051957 RepID=UPI000E5B0802|nr:ring-cleaving dioxygenase [Rubrobacter indicoceani]
MSVAEGLHHVTAISGGAQANVDFYVGVLGLRFIKRTVNFDDPGTYHLYYGDGEASPGTVMTFFPWANAPKGTQGSGQLTVTAFGVPKGSLDYWRARLTENGIEYGETESRFGDEVLPFADESGMRVELVAAEDPRKGWDGGPVPEEFAVRGFHSVTLSVRNPARTGEVLGVLGFREAVSADGRTRYEAGAGGIGNSVDLVDGSGGAEGRMGVGTVHHVAFRVPNDRAHGEVREKVSTLGFDVTPVLDRNYFHSIYFREPGGVLFEIATDNPGFDADEPMDELGRALKLPGWLEPRRERIEQVLDPLTIPGGER